MNGLKKELVLFSEIAQAISAKPFLEALTVIAEKAAIMMDAEHCCCVIRNKEEKLVIKAGYPFGVHGVGQEIAGESAVIMKEMERINRRFKLVINPAQNPKTASYLKGFAEHHHLTAVFFVALVSKKELVGFMVFDFVIYPRKKVRTAKIIADFVASQIETMRGKEREKEKEDRLHNLRVLGEHSARAAHLVKNSLMQIGGHAHRLEKSITLDDHDRMHASIIYQEILSLEKDMRNVLSISRFSPENLHPKRCDVHGTLKNIVKRLHGLHPKHPLITLKTEETEQPIFIMLNEDWIRNCVDDIVGNAIDFNAQNVWIKTHIDATDECFLICIENDGEAIDPRKINVGDISEIFSPFFSTKKGGTGLGLSTVQCMVESHGGKITVKSICRDSCSEGLAPCTTFTISLPL